MNSITKQCQKCKNVKAAKDYCVDNKFDDGLRRICRDCTREIERDRYKNWSQEKKDKNRIYHKNLRNEARKKIISIYGGKCSCCGEERFEFLAIDHVNGNGNNMRKNKIHPQGAGFYYWLVKNNYPKDFQILCHNCNMAKAFYGYCPHKQEK